VPPIILAQNSGHNDPNFLATVGDLGNYIFSREVFTSTLLDNPAAHYINEKMLERTGFPLDGNSGRAFMGTLVMADALNRAKSLEPEDIRQALLETDIPAEMVIFPWDGIRFDQETHQITSGSGIVVQIQNLQYLPVWPYEIAATEPIFPIPHWSER
jgi:branched-chain amino acid transport system substrate-binding protein